jgi:hypothetical protein
LGATDYSFGQSQGLSLSGALGANPGVYSIEMVFRLSDTDGYRKIIDFKNLASDTGLYDCSGELDLFPVASGSVSLSAGVDAHVVLTRDAASHVVGYVDGQEQFDFLDSAGYGVFDQPDNIIQLFKDDGATGGREVSAGAVEWIQIYDAALTPDEVAHLSSDQPTVPEPPAAVMICSLLGALGIAAGLRRCKRAAR